MADQRDRAATAAAAARVIVRRIARSLPGVRENSGGRFAFSIEHKGKDKGIAWSWLERIHPRKARVPNDDILAIRVADQLEKEALLAADPDKFFTEPHYNGYPAVLVRLAAVTEPELRKLLTDAWECQAPRELREGIVAVKPAARSRKPATAAPAKRKPAARATRPASPAGRKAAARPTARKAAPATTKRKPAGKDVKALRRKRR